MSLHLLAIGDNYSGESYALDDCELDAANIVEALKPYCANAVVLIGKAATRDGIRAAVATFVGAFGPDDMGLIYNSGHGTTDVVQGKKVAAIVCNGGKLIYGFEMRKDLNNRVDGSMIVAGSDSCFAGLLPRALTKGKARTIPVEQCVRHRVRFPVKTPQKPNAIFAACGPREVSYSTGNGGAFTIAFLKAFNERKDDTTLPALFKRIRKLLPSRKWPQTPAFEIDSALEKRTLKSFRSA